MRALDHLGPKVTDGGVSFNLYSENATRVELLLVSDPEAELPSQRYAMTRLGDVWSVFVRGVGYGQHYGYLAWGPNWEYVEEWHPGAIDGFVTDVDAEGNRFNPNKLLIDPYGRALHRDHDWGRASAATGPARTESTWGAGSKSVVVESDYEWSEEERAYRERTLRLSRGAARAVSPLR